MAHCPNPALLSESSSRTGLILVDVGWVCEEVKESAFVYLYVWFLICEFILDYVTITHCRLYKIS